MTHIRPNLRLYLANRWWVVGTPVFILALMTLISIAIAGIIGLGTGFPIPPDAQEGMRSNAGALFSIPGFLVSVGVLAMNRNFSMALSFGSTRRHFWLGTALGFVLTSLVVAVSALGFLGLELLTNHWFFGARAFDVALLGDGNALQTFLTMFVLALLSLFAGAFFGTVFRAFGPTWTALAAILTGAALLGCIALVVANWTTLLPVIADLGMWLALNVAAVLALLAAAGSYAVNRVATV